MNETKRRRLFVEAEALAGGGGDYESANSKDICTWILLAGSWVRMESRGGVGERRKQTASDEAAAGSRAGRSELPRLPEQVIHLISTPPPLQATPEFHGRSSVKLQPFFLRPKNHQTPSFKGPKEKGGEKKQAASRLFMAREAHSSQLFYQLQRGFSIL